VHLGAHQAIGLGNYFWYGNCCTWQELVPRPHGLAIRRNERCKFRLSKLVVLMNDEKVLQQIVAFIKNGMFSRDKHTEPSAEE